MNDDDDLVEGRPRRGRSILVGAIGLVLLGALPVVFGLLAGEPGRVDPAPTGPAGAVTPAFLDGLSGRLVYVADEPGRPLLQRLWVLDLITGTFAQGPRFPNVGGPYELRAAGPDLAWPILVRHGPESFADLFQDLSADAEPLEVGRGDLVSLSADGSALLVADVDFGRAPGCTAPAYRLRTVELDPARPPEVLPARLPCGRLTNVTLYGRDAVITLAGSGPSRVFALRSGGADQLFSGVVAGSSSGTQLIASRGSHLLVWPGGGALRPIVTASSLTGNVLAASADGRYVAVDGRIRDERGLWVVDVPAGTARLLPPPRNPSLSELSSATFDAEDRLFAAGPGRILAEAGSALLPLVLPVGAPPPVGPVVWLP
jgi:hypothetical protein